MKVLSHSGLAASSLGICAVAWLAFLLLLDFALIRDQVLLVIRLLMRLMLKGVFLSVRAFLLLLEGPLLAGLFLIGLFLALAVVPGAAEGGLLLLLFLGLALDDCGWLLAFHIDLAVEVENFEQSVDVVDIEGEDLSCVDVGQFLHFQFLREQHYQLVQFLCGRVSAVLLDLDDLDAEFAEDELADVEVGAPLHQHLLVDEARVPCVGADYLHQLHQVPHPRSL
jgi:hypothetical protein